MKEQIKPKYFKNYYSLLKQKSVSSLSSLNSLPKKAFQSSDLLICSLMDDYFFGYSLRTLLSVILRLRALTPPLFYLRVQFEKYHLRFGLQRKISSLGNATNVWNINFENKFALELLLNFDLGSCFQETGIQIMFCHC